MFYADFMCLLTVRGERLFCNVKDVVLPYFFEVVVPEFLVLHHAADWKQKPAPGLLSDQSMTLAVLINIKLKRFVFIRFFPSLISSFG